MSSIALAAAPAKKRVFLPKKSTQTPLFLLEGLWSAIKALAIICVLFYKNSLTSLVETKIAPYLCFCLLLSPIIYLLVFYRLINSNKAVALFEEEQLKPAIPN
ncbi:MAG: hypothetical protein R2777_06205 [Chitinophagales bacterium]